MRGTAGGLLSSLKIRSKLLIIYVLVGLLPMLALSIYLVGNTRQNVLDQHGGLVVADNQRARDVLFDVTYLCANVSDSLEFDDGLNDIIATRYASSDDVYDAYRQYSLIDSFARNYTQLSGITIYVNNPTMITSGHFVVADDATRASAWYQSAVQSYGQPIWVYDTTLNSWSNFRLVRRISIAQTNEFAVMVINVSDYYFDSLLGQSSITTLLCLNGKQTFYAGDSAAELGKGIPFMLQPQRNPVRPEAYPADYQGAHSMVYNSTLAGFHTNDLFQIVTVDTAAFADADRSAGFLILVLLIAAAAPLPIILVFTGYLSRRIIALRGAMRRVAHGELGAPAPFAGRDELGELAADMNTTISGIRSLHSEILAENIARQELQTQQRNMEFKMLASQINPHFLFNTLETIRMKAALCGDGETAEISKQLGRLMRRALQTRDNPSTLQSELDAIQSYLFIQRFRFGEKILYSIEIDESINPQSYKLLPLLLQPLIENAMIHGLERKEGNGQIVVRIAPQGGKLCICVQDDGVGMQEETLRHMQHQLSQTRDTASGSIGLHNISQRIRLFYGEPYGLEVESGPDRGTTVRLYLPLGEAG